MPIIRRSLRACVIGACFVSSFIIAGSAQQQQSPPKPPEQDAVVRISTQLVQIDAVVINKKGEHVDDLTDADFELLVDGKKQSLSHFSLVKLPELKREPVAKTKSAAAPLPATMPTRPLEPKEVRRTIAVVIDDLGLSFSSTYYAREAAKKFIDEQMQEGDMVAIIRTGGGLGMLEQFTSDKRLLHTAVDRLAWNPLARNMIPSFDTGSGASSASEESEESEETTTTTDASASVNAFRDALYTEGTLGAVNFVVRALGQLPGRKSIILISDGFQIINRDNNELINDNLLWNRARLLVDLANRSSVVIYTIDAKGLLTMMPGGDVGAMPTADQSQTAANQLYDSWEGLNFLAQETGGIAVLNSNDINLGIEEALRDQSSYYLLGFDPDDAQFDQRYHKLKVKVTRAGLSVRTRSGFIGFNDGAARDADSAAAAAANAKLTGNQQILAALRSPFGARELTLQMTASFFNAEKEGPVARSLFHIDASKLTFKDGEHGEKRLKLELVAFTYNEAGLPANLLSRTFTLNFTEEQYRRTLAKGLVYQADFQMKKPGAYQFRAALRDAASGRVGTASQFIQMPDLKKKRLALSGLVLSAPKAVGELAEEIQPTPAVRRFPHNGVLDYSLVVYNAALDKKTGRPQLTAQTEIYRDGKLVLQLPARPLEFAPNADLKRLNYAGRLRPINLPPGDYLLRLAVTDTLAKKNYATADQWMDFSVR